jgi:hypothetical protein
MRYGEYAADGTIARDVSICYMTGAVIQPGDASVNLSGTPYFYKISVAAMPLFTEDKRREIEQEIMAANKPASKKQKGEVNDGSN